MQSNRLRQALAALSLLALLPAAQASALRPEGAPVILQQDTHFPTPGGGMVLLEQGNYYVAPNEKPPLVVTREYDEKGVELAAVVGKHDEKLEEPYAESIGAGGDAHHLILLLPNGTSIDATGSLSGVATRSVNALDAASVRSYREAWAAWPPPGVTTRSALAPRPTPPPITVAAGTPGFEPNIVIVKFREGAAVRLPEVATRSGERPSLQVDQSLMGRMERLARLARERLTVDSISADLTRVNDQLRASAVSAWVPLVDRAERFMEAERHAAEQASGSEIGDLGNTFAIKLSAGSEMAGVLERFRALGVVETAYPAPIPQDADIPPPTPDWQGSQGYLESASSSPPGIDAKYAWTRPGGKGAGVYVIDVEQSWQLDHEDLPARLASLNDPGGQQEGDGQHGVAVLGEIVALADGHGVTGIAHEGRFNVAPVNRKHSFLWVDWTERSVAAAITAAASRLRRGDVILIEQHYPSGLSSGTCPAACGNCPQWGYVPMEYFVPEFIAIHNATARGIHVVEAAGNGGMDLDHSRYGNEFKRNVYDSRAIMVGASDANLRPSCWSNFGSRVDVHAWGTNIMTLGYGNQLVTGAPPADKKQWYTRTFGGTSGASPIVVGAVMAIVGAQKAAGQTLLTPLQMRSLLVSTGTAQQAYTPPAGMAAETRNIGPQPDLKRALDRQVPPAPAGMGGGGS